MRTFSIKRPVSIGTFPKDRYTVNEIVNFDARTFCPEIGREAWGYIDYEGYLPKKALDDYELIAQEYQVYDTWKKLVDMYAKYREHGYGPNETIEGLRDHVSDLLIKNLFATYCKVRSHDGRISDKNRDFYSVAVICEDTAKWESWNPITRMGLDDIHPAHVDQLMDSFRKTEATS